MPQQNLSNFWFELWMHEGKVLGEAITQRTFHERMTDYADVKHHTIGEHRYHVGWKDSDVSLANAWFFIQQFEMGRVTNLTINVKWVK